MGLLDADAMERLGYALENHAALVTPGFECIWPDLKGRVGAPLAIAIDASRADVGYNYPVDLAALRDQTILGLEPVDP